MASKQRKSSSAKGNQLPKERAPKPYGIGYWASGWNCYQSVNPMLQPVLLLVLNELRPELHNAFIQCFASRGQVRRAAFKRLAAMDWRELDEAFWDFFVGLQSHFTAKGSEVITMKKDNELTPETIMETGKQLRESLLAVLTPEERLAGLAPEELVALAAQIETYLRKQGKSQSSATKPETN